MWFLPCIFERWCDYKRIISWATERGNLDHPRSLEIDIDGLSHKTDPGDSYSSSVFHGHCVTITDTVIDARDGYKHFDRAAVYGLWRNRPNQFYPLSTDLRTNLHSALERASGHVLSRCLSWLAQQIRCRWLSDNPHMVSWIMTPTQDLRSVRRPQFTYRWMTVNDQMYEVRCLRVRHLIILTISITTGFRKGNAEGKGLKYCVTRKVSPFVHPTYGIVHGIWVSHCC